MMFMDVSQLHTTEMVQFEVGARPGCLVGMVGLGQFLGNVISSVFERVH